MKLSEKQLVNKLQESKKLEQKLEKQLIDRIKKTINSNKPNNVKAKLVFNEFFEVYHQSKLYWLKRGKKALNN
ncbi:hypothetical protein METP2_02749 [Methanosarcinales archaeon]|nr:hypothetical protein [Flavobacteriales bacterium]CAG0993295.1 hypothetical protein METP2_02749 [Methanosarcinales archaeon]